MQAGSESRAERFLELLQPLERELEVYARRMIWEPQQVSDAVQNAVLRAFGAFDRYRADASFRAWMFRILTREVMALNRRYARLARHEFQLDPEALAELEAGESRQTSGGMEPAWLSGADLDRVLEPELTRALRTLTDTERAVLLLRAIGELRYREISEALEVPMGTVMGSLARARQKMRAALRSSGALPGVPQPRTQSEL